MTIIDYILIFLTIPMWIGLGRLVIKDLEAIPALLAGLFIAGGTVAATCRIAPIFTREILIIFVLLGSFQVVKDKEYFSKIKNIPIQYIIILICMAIIFRNFHYTNWMYETGQLVYFDPGIEMLKADYFGNLRVSVSYPSARAGMHLTPTGLLSSLLVFISKPNLFHFIEMRYILTTLFFTDFAYRFLKRFSYSKGWLSWPMARSIGALICAGSLYSSELSYDITISSFLYVYCLLRLFSLSFENRFQSPETFFFLIILCSAKAPIILIAVSFTAFFAIFNIQYLFRKEIIIAGFILLANAISWKLIHAPMDESGSISFIIPRSINDFMGGAAIRDPIIGQKNWDYSIIISYTFSRIYLIFFLILFFKAPRKSVIIFAPYMILSILDLIFVRDTYNLITHQRHAYFLAAVVTSFAVAESIAAIPLLIFPAIPLARIFMRTSLLATLPQYQTDIYPILDPLYHYLSYDEYLNNINNNLPFIRYGFYTPDPKEPYWLTELKTSMLGVRVRKELVHPDYGQNRLWILP